MVAFVCGGPGRGKTALVNEFTRRALVEHTDLLVAKGNCNAYSGIGDAYLPFREIMGMLGGDVEALWKTGTITTEHARRLWNGMPDLARALLYRGPNLFESLISGGELLERVSVAKPGDAELLEGLRDSAEREQIQSDQMRQVHLFEQFTNVLCLLSEISPILLLLDDLQWSDNASISLLFHLGRRLEGSRILIVGAYRAEEVAMQRDGERHPLEQLLAELKRRFGDVWVDLSEVEDKEDATFVDALLESEPNRFDAEFHSELLQRTGGHPLYTIELIRSMQERGDLICDEEGVWMVGSEIDWEKLPARVEAVIGERIARLEPKLSQILKTASVEGEDFSVQVVAGVQELPERDVMQLLSTELENRHRLVTEQAGLAVDHQVLFRYRFAHNLIQQYLYNGIGEGERILLHGEIADHLKQLAEADTEQVSGSVVLQLGWHYSQAGENERAVEYLIKGGEQAFRSDAYDEAKLCYRQALDVFSDQENEKRASLLYELGKTHERMAEYTPAEKYLEKALELAGDIGVTRLEIKALHSLCFTSRIQGNYNQTYKYAQQSLELAEKSGDLPGKMRSLKLLGISLGLRGDLLREEEFYKKSLAIAREINDEIEESACLSNLGILAYLHGDVAEAERLTKQALEIAIERNHKWRMALYMDNLASFIWRRGRSKEARKLLNESLMIAQQIGNMWQTSRALDELGLISFSFGKYEEAIDYSTKGLNIARERNLIHAISGHLYILGIVSLETGRYKEAREHFKESYDNLEEIDDKEHIGWCICGLGLVDCAQGFYDKSLKRLNKCLKIAEKQNDSFLAGYVHLSLGRVSWTIGKHQEAHSYLQEGLKILTSRDDRGDMAFCYTYLGHNSLFLDEFDSARNYYRHALEICAEIEMMPVIAETLVGASLLFSKTGKQPEAVRLAAFVIGQKECSYATQERARNMLEEFSKVMVRDEFEGAKNKGRMMDLEQALKVVEPTLIA
jgi:predicted ATPase